MGEAKNPALKIDSQTIFIESAGFWQLVSRSKKPSAKELWRKITHDILPTLFTKGTYTLPPNEVDIAQLNKNFYDDHYISNLQKYIGDLRNNRK